MSPSQWRKAGRPDLEALELLLRQRESRALGFIGRILRDGRLRLPNPLRGGIWLSEPPGLGAVPDGALLATSGRIVSPLLPESTAGDREIGRILAAEYPDFASIVGPAESVERLERSLGRPPLVAVGYRSMLKPTAGLPTPANPAGLEVRRAFPEDLELLIPLQAAYEVEEVLTPIHRFDAAGSRAALARSLEEAAVWMATCEGRPVGKAAINARSFGLDQLGGIFVEPAFRGRGFGRALVLSLLGEIEAAGRRAGLFVKPGNRPAHSLYASLGFEEIGDYRADYYGL